MSDADDTLHALWAQDELPPRDAAFVARVMERVARRRFEQSVGRASFLATAAAVLLWAVAPTVESAVRAIPVVTDPGIIALAATGAIGAWLVAASVWTRSDI